MSPEQQAASACAAAVNGVYAQMYAALLAGQDAQVQAFYAGFQRERNFESHEIDVLNWALTQTEALVNHLTTEEKLSAEVAHRCGVS